MNKKLLMLAGVLTACVLVAMGGVFASVMNQTNPLEKMGLADLPAKVYQSLGIKTPAQMKQAMQFSKTDENGLTSSSDTSLSTANNITAPVVKTDSDILMSVEKSRLTPAQIAQAAPRAANTTQVTGVAVSASQARSIAQRAAPSAQFSAPELVRYSGKVAYEVVSKNGNVYVDANTGAVLDNGVATSAQPRGYEDDDDEREHRSKKRSKHHERDEDDDDDEDEDHRG